MRLAVGLVLALAGAALAQETHKLGAIGGFSQSSDGMVVVVSLPDKAQLAFVSVVKGPRLVELEFQPEHLAQKGSSLLATTRGGSAVHLLDLSGKIKKSIAVPGCEWTSVAWHPTKNVAFAAAQDGNVWVLDWSTGKPQKTPALGSEVACDPRGEFLFTGTNAPADEYVLVEKNGSKEKVRFVTRPETGALRKYRIDSWALVAGNANASLGAGGRLSVSPDGKRCAYAAGGGHRPEGETRMRYAIAVFQDDLATLVGHVELGAYPASIAFHPALDLGAAVRHDGEVQLFKTSSLAPREKVKLDGKGRFLGFAGKGTRLLHVSEDSVVFVPLSLTEEETKKLAATHGSLPEGKAEPPRAGEPPGNSEKDRPTPDKLGKPDKPGEPAKEAARDLVTLEKPDRGYGLRAAAVGSKLYTDQAGTISALPEALAGSMMLVRRFAQHGWLPHESELTANRDLTVFVAVGISLNGVKRVTDDELAAFVRDGWKPVEGTFSTEARDKVSWRVFSRPVGKGPIDVPDKAHLSTPGYLFFFR